MTSDRFDMMAAPLRVGAVRLRVRDLDRVARFYETALGLAPLASTPDSVTLGAGGTALLELAGDPRLRPRDPRDAGLYHTAFLLPDRAALGRWLGHAAATRLPLQGASDHLVSEAAYLADPEGNGIEIYADRGPSRWLDESGAIRMATLPMDVRAVMAAAGGRPWDGMPAGSTVGHVHMQVGDTAEADRFWQGLLGFDRAATLPGAHFYGSGGYHHQIAGNVWHSRGAGRRPDDAAGLDRVALIAADQPAWAALHQRLGGDLGADALRDPWGTAIAINPPTAGVRNAA